MKKSLIIYLSIITVFIIIAIVIMGIFKFNVESVFYILVSLVLITIPLSYLIFIIIKEAKDLSYNSKKHEVVGSIVAIMFGTILIYLSLKLDGYSVNEYPIVYYCLILGAVLITIAIIYIVSKKKGNEPKIIRNR